MGKLWLFIIGVLAGLLVLAAWRFMTYQTTAVHYHANFAVYINGQREPFAEATYYEEESNCSADDTNNPRERAHLHDHVSDLVHVHASGVTWNQLFENLGWGIGPTYVQTRTQLLVADAQNPLTYWLNGKQVSNPANMVIGDKDKLLVSYGAANQAQLQAQFSGIPSTASQADVSPDPQSCGGAAPITWHERLNHIFQ